VSLGDITSFCHDVCNVYSGKGTRQTCNKLKKYISSVMTSAFVFSCIAPLYRRLSSFLIVIYTTHSHNTMYMNFDDETIAF
jgi:hypothetical protein